MGIDHHRRARSSVKVATTRVCYVNTCHHNYFDRGTLELQYPIPGSAPRPLEAVNQVGSGAIRSQCFRAAGAPLDTPCCPNAEKRKQVAT